MGVELMRKVLAILQARFSSSRLPGKVLLPILEKPMLYQQIRRVERSKKIDQLVVATSVDESDDPIEKMCHEYGIKCFRGNLNDVLDRFYQVTRQYESEHIVRLTGDCPLIDWRIIDQVIDEHLKTSADYTSNTFPATYPDGLDVEVMKASALSEAWEMAKTAPEREHVTVYIRENKQFKQACVANEVDLSSHRWTVDEKYDLDKIRLIYQALHSQKQDFQMKDILDYLKKNPNVDSLNTAYKRNEGMIKSMKQEMNKFLDGTGQELYEKAKTLIPGGTQLLSKRPEMLLPQLWPSYYQQAKGIRVTDLDGNEFIDMSHNAIGTCILGAADEDVNTAVIEAVTNGVSSTLNCPEEVELAELLCEIHPWASKVRYARTGGEAMSIAVRIARAKTGRDKVAFCGYHGWHDWYLSANLAEDANLDGHLLPGLSPRGVPRGLKGTAIPFRYNHIEDLEKILTENEGEMAAIVMEPIRSEYPENNFLQKARKLADQYGVVLIFDEITAGFRLCTGGAHLLLGVTPDIAVFGKAMSNGHPMAAIIGNEVTMQAAQETFVSSTYWTDRVGPVAALATIHKFTQSNVCEYLNRLGKEVQQGWCHAAKEAGLKIHVGGIFPLSHFSFEHEKSNIMRTLFTQEMLRRGYLATGGLYLTYSHTQESIEQYLGTVKIVFRLIALCLNENTLESMLVGKEAHCGFKRLT